MGEVSFPNDTPYLLCSSASAVSEVTRWVSQLYYTWQDILLSCNLDVKKDKVLAISERSGSVSFLPLPPPGALGL